MPGRTDIDTQWLLGLVRTIEEEVGAEVNDSPMLGLQIVDRRHGEIEVQLLGHPALGHVGVVNEPTCRNAIRGAPDG